MTTAEPTPDRPVRIGITGPIGCGKSTVAGWLGEMGATVIDADRVARRLTPPGSAALAAIVDAFGRRILRSDGTLDRAALGRIVFRDAAELERLEAIIHPLVRPRILELLASADTAPPAGSGGRGRPNAIVIEAIKLVEGGLAALCDEIWLVTCAASVQHSRLAARGAAAGQPADLADTEARIAAQSHLVERLTPSATRIIDTSGSVAQARSRVEAALHAALEARR
jgi:dephospho-CoA kinase